METDYREEVIELKKEVLNLDLVDNVWLNTDEMEIRLKYDDNASVVELKNIIKNDFSEKLKWIGKGKYHYHCKIIIPKKGLYLEIENLEKQMLLIKKQISEKKAILKATERKEKRVKKIEKLREELRMLEEEELKSGR